MAAALPSPKTPPLTMVSAMAHARAAFASLQQHGLTPVPLHYGLWFEHHAATRPELSSALAEALSRGAVDEALMRALHHRFLEPLPEFATLGQALAELSGTLKEALGTMGSHGADSAAFSDALEELSADALHDPQRLRQTLLHLASQARMMTRRSLDMRRRIAQSSGQIEMLRSELEDARRDAETDALTGLSNRRAFDQRLAQLAREAISGGQPLALILIDIDHFKSVNDRFGHAVGDRVLRVIADALSQCCRGHLVSRYGGEEFAILFTNVRLDQAQAVLEHARATVQAKRYKLRDNDAPLGEITFSAGLTPVECGEMHQTAFHRADRLLYLAKSEGRNQIQIGSANYGESRR